MKNILITGSTGMVGSHILELCLNSKRIGKIISLSRRNGSTKDKKLEEIRCNDFLLYPNLSHAFQNIDVAFFCLGVYTGNVSREKFRTIMKDFPIAFGKQLKKYSPKATLVFLTGMGADRTGKSRFAFAKDRGLAEQELSTIFPKSFYCFRPGYIYPVHKRKEPNFSYQLSRTLYPLLKIFGKGYSIKSTELSQAMFHVGLNGYDKAILENKDIYDAL